MNLQELISIPTVYASGLNNSDPQFRANLECTSRYGKDLFIRIEKINKTDTCVCKDTKNSSEIIKCTSIPPEQLTEYYCKIGSNMPKYSERIAGKDGIWSCNCSNGTAKDGVTGNDKEPKECIINKEGTLGINCKPEQLINNTCSWDINKTLGIRRSDPNPSPTLLLQDVTLAATSFIGTIIMVAMIWLGIQAVLKGAGDGDAMSDIKGKIKNLAIGLLLVIGSYTIIRLVQYVARGY